MASVAFVTTEHNEADLRAQRLAQREVIALLCRLETR
jgi:hypothetical protein